MGVVAMVNLDMTVRVRGEEMVVNVVGLYHQATNRSYLRITLPNGVTFDHRSHQGFANPWASTHYVQQVIESTKWWQNDALTPYPLLDSGKDQLQLF